MATKDEVKKVELPIPNEEKVEEYLKKWEANEDYQLTVKALELLFNDFCKENNDEVKVLIKVSALNSLYSTQLNRFGADKLMARHIVGIKDFRKRVNEGDANLVDEIKKIPGQDKNYYSFATKFCSYSNPKFYPIYDSYVVKVLVNYRKKNKFSSFTIESLKKYEKFRAVIDDFRNYYGLSSYSYTAIDMFLWQLGKEFYSQKKVEEY